MSYNPAQQYRQASFAGCEFEVIDVRDQFGHRVAIHEYPERDIPWSESMGRQVRIFRFRAGIWGEDHVERARELIRKVECGATERLVHPIWGEFDVKGIQASPSHRPCARDGETILDLQFVEAGEFIYPTVTPFQGGAVGAAVVGVADTVFNTIVFGQALFNTNLFGLIGGLAANLRGLFNSNIDWNGRTVAIANDLDAAQVTPEQYTDDDFRLLIRQSIEAIYVDAQTPAQARDALCSLMDYETGATGSLCEYALYTRLLAITYAAQAGIDAGYTNPVEAIAFMECLLGHIERDQEISAEKCFDQIYTQLECLASGIAKDYRFLAFGLPPVLSIDCGGVPLLVAAYNIFGNLDTLEQFEELNAVQDAMFMPNTVLYQAQ